jgi:hypothetical protein
MKLASGLVSAVLVLSLGLVASAQVPSKETDKEKANKEFELGTLVLKAKLLEARATLYSMDPASHKEDAGAAEELANIYRRVFAESDTAGWFFGPIYADYLASKQQARSAPQVSQVANEATVKFQFMIAAQNQVLIEQNKKIIALLETIAKKPSR